MIRKDCILELRIPVSKKIKFIKRTVYIKLDFYAWKLLCEKRQVANPSELATLKPEELILELSFCGAISAHQQLYTKPWFTEDHFNWFIGYCITPDQMKELNQLFSESIATDPFINTMNRTSDESEKKK